MELIHSAGSYKTTCQFSDACGARACLGVQHVPERMWWGASSVMMLLHVKTLALRFESTVVGAKRFLVYNFSDILYCAALVCLYIRSCNGIGQIILY